jgi:hypothetical protein
MKEQTLKRLLNTSLDLLISLEQFADEATQKDINALFDEVNFNDDNLLADLEAQEWEVFGENKV